VRRSGVEELQQVVAELLLAGVGDAVRRARVHLEYRAVDEGGRGLAIRADQAAR
jgi:hypothetical protein